MVYDKSFGIWVRNWRFPSFMIVQWTSNVGGQRVCRGLFCPVQLINPKIIPPVGEGGELLNNVLYGKAPPRHLTPYTFIVEGAPRVFLGLEPLHKKFNVTQFFAQSI